MTIDDVIQSAGRRLADAPVDAPDARRLVEVRQRRRRAGRFVAGAAVALVLLGGAGTMLAQTDDSTQVATDPDGIATEGPPADEINPPGRDVSLWLSADRVPPGDVEMAGVLVAHTDTPRTYGLRTQVDRWDGDQWVPHRQLVMCLDHWHCTAEMQPLGASVDVDDIGLAATRDGRGALERFTIRGLDEGWYRISHTNGAEASGVFEIAEGAPEPAPLWPTDRPALSISPALVPATGATVAISPLIPASGGSQSAEDIERAVDGLADTATIERWEVDEWVPIDELDLELDPDGIPTGRAAVMPSLEPGAYRLVRTGPGEPHVGNFWMDAGDDIETKDDASPAPVDGLIVEGGGDHGALSIRVGELEPSPMAWLQHDLIIENHGDETIYLDDFRVSQGLGGSPPVLIAALEGCGVSGIEGGPVGAGICFGYFSGHTIPAGGSISILVTLWKDEDGMGPLEPGTYPFVVEVPSRSDRPFDPGEGVTNGVRVDEFTITYTAGVTGSETGAATIPGTTQVSGVLRMVGGPVGSEARLPAGVAGTVSVATEHGEQLASATTDDEGRFTFHLRPGTYRITGTSPNYNRGEGECTAWGDVVVSDEPVSGTEVACIMR
ncbi:MAG: carboxypeptidase regulatory-like domain-containing protein [Acidimicrobiia bacterium]|nr:carboxypeptidase regulatory-like domain-containing protein [Acidimicrobiia bacterium]